MLDKLPNLWPLIVEKGMKITVFDLHPAMKPRVMYFGYT